MIIEMVMFDRPPGFSDTDLLEDARSTVAHWQANPDLVRKQFLKGDGEVVGLCLWPDRAAAERAHDAAWVDRFRARRCGAADAVFRDVHGNRQRGGGGAGVSVTPNVGCVHRMLTRAWPDLAHVDLYPAQNAWRDDLFHGGTCASEGNAADRPCRSVAKSGGRYSRAKTF